MTPGSVFKKNILDPYPKSPPFWKPYDELNDVTIPDLEAIKNYQISKIEMFEKASMEGLLKKSEAINQLFQSGDINSLVSEKEQLNQKTLDKVITEIVGKFNSMRFATYDKEKDDYNYKYMSDFAKSLILMIDSINNRLGKDGMIPSYYIDKLNALIEACQLGSLSRSALKEWMLKLSNFQGALLEDLAVEWLKANRIPEDIKVLNTGSVRLSGTTRQNRHNGQLIQDLMMLSIDSQDVLGIEVSYKPAGGDKYITSTLDQLLKDIEAANGSSKQISINDDTYDVIQKLSVMNIQAKSGKKQLPWNKNASTNVSIAEYSEDNLSLSAKRTFQLLHSLDQEGGPDEDNSWIKSTHRNYNLLADYGLATVLIKVLHLNGPEGNQYLITPDGFTLYSTRLKHMMEQYKSYIRIVGDVNIKNSLDTKYSVGMQGLN